MFSTAVGAAMLALMLFNFVVDKVVLASPGVGSLETVAGFERTMKPAWLASLHASIVVVGSSRVRDGFDPTLVHAALNIHTFNYGMSSITPYELRRLVQDAAAQTSTRIIVVPLDAFMEPGSHTAQTLSGFDEQRLAVTDSGAPTSHRGLWLFATRYLSGGATAMHALSLYLLENLGGSNVAADRPDLFSAYRSATPQSLSHDLEYRSKRIVHMLPWERAEFQTMLGALCNSSVALSLFFPPDSWAMQRTYDTNDPNGLALFKRSIEEDVENHNGHCKEQAQLFDFMQRTPLTDPATAAALGENYSDAVHFRPPVGLSLLRFMLASPPARSTVGARLIPQP